MSDAAPIALWQQLQATATVLVRIRGGASGNVALAAVDARLRPGVQALSFHTLRWLGRAEALRRHLARRAPPAAADALLCTSLALCWDEALAPYEPYALVDQAVEAAKRDPATRAQASFINACLRRFLREREALVQLTDGEPVGRWNHPRWWIERLRLDQPRAWQRQLDADNRPPPLTLRVNTTHVSVAGYQARLLAVGIASFPVGASGLQLATPLPVARLPGFDAGDVSVQDAAAQLAAPLLLAGLGPRAQPLRILDACAAPGGKTAHLLELLARRGPDAGHVLALEIDAARAPLIEATLGRLALGARSGGDTGHGAAVTVRVADAADPAGWYDGTPFDAILLDAPCTASGIVRRHPDVRWLRRESDIEQLARQQQRLLAALWPLLQRQGLLLYCTCSVFRAEGSVQIEAFLRHNTDARLRPSPGHLLTPGIGDGTGLPDNRHGDHDGFFYALLEKAA